MFCRFKSRLLKQLHPALLRGGQCGLSSFLCSRRSSHSIAAARSGPCASCGRMAPSAPSMENAAVPATAANIAATRRRYQPVTAVPSGAAAHAYYRADDDYQGRTTVPALIDTTTGKVVNNDYNWLTTYFEVNFLPWHKKGAPERAYNAAPAISADTSAFHKNAFRNTRLRSIAPPPFPVSSVLHSTWI